MEMMGKDKELLAAFKSPQWVGKAVLNAGRLCLNQEEGLPDSSSLNFSLKLIRSSA